MARLRCAIISIGRILGILLLQLPLRNVAMDGSVSSASPLRSQHLPMTTVARISGGVTIHQYHRDHHPPHFHAVDGDDEALIEIAEPLKVFKVGLKPGARGDVRNWASPRRALLALNWVDALALAPIKRIPSAMTAGTLRKIRTVEARSGYRLLISWFQGPHMIVDLSEEIRQGGVFDSLRSETEFSRVRVGERNRVVEWPEPKDDHGYPLIEIDADALYLLGSQQKTSASMRKLISTAQSIGRSEQPT